MRIVQASVAKRIAFATWARKQGLKRHSSVSFYLPDDVTAPEELMDGAQVDGQPYSVASKTSTRRRKRKDVGVVAEPDPAPAVEEPQETEEPSSTFDSGWSPSVSEESNQEE